VITTVDPLVGVIIGVSWFGESINTDGWSLFGELISALVIVSGIVLLARRGGHLMHAAEHDKAPASQPHRDTEASQARGADPDPDDGLDGLAFSADGR
jgi:hypothetical protein